MAPKKAGSNLTPLSVTLSRNKVFVDVIQLRILRWEGDPGLSRGP